MKRLLTAVVLIPLVLLLVFKAHPLLLLLVVAVVSWFSLKEFVEITKGHALMPRKGLLYCYALLPYVLPFVLASKGDELEQVALSFFLTLLVFSPFVFLASSIFGEKLAEALPSASVSLFAFLYIDVGLFSVWALNGWHDYGSLLVFCLFVIVWSGDISAYYVGRYLGRRKLAPRISPNKTWEGALASFAIATALGSAVLVNLNPIFKLLVTHGLVTLHEPPPRGWDTYLPIFPVWFALAASAIINVAAQLGDLMESAMKRGANLKDSGTIVPGHGGILDRIDALLFAAPVAMLLFATGSTIFLP